MAPSQSIIIPSKEPLPHALRLPSAHPLLLKTFSRLSRSSLLQLAIDWCSDSNVATCGPFINKDYEPDDSDVSWTAHNTVKEVADYYREEVTRKSFKRELIDHVLESDWRHGISLQQLAMVECQILADHPESMMWTAFQLQQFQDGDFMRNTTKQDSKIPRIHAPSLILALHQEIVSLTKAHYHITRHASLPLTIIRIALYDTPYADLETSLRPESIISSKSIFLGFPDGAPFVYVSLPGVQAMKNMETERSLMAYIIKMVPKAMSRPLDRYDMRPTQLTARSLATLLAMRGPTRESGVGGGWSSYASDDMQPKALEVAIEHLVASSRADDLDDNSSTQDAKQRAPKRTFVHSDPTGHLPARKRKRLKEMADGRFGQIGTPADKQALNRFDIKIEDSVDGTGWRPSVQLSFQGSHVFAGLRKLTEFGVIDAGRMPAWTTGEAACSVGTVKNGRVSMWHEDSDD